MRHIWGKAGSKRLDIDGEHSRAEGLGRRLTGNRNLCGDVGLILAENNGKTSLQVPGRKQVHETQLSCTRK